MKRIVCVAATVAALAFTAVPSAKADFHPACLNNAGNAGVALTESAGTLRFSGTITCNGASSVDITSLMIRPMVPPGPQTSATTLGSCGPCGTTPVTASGSVPATAGYYEVAMAVTVVDGDDGRAYKPTRRAQYLYAGTGQPVRTCTAPPNWAAGAAQCA